MNHLYPWNISPANTRSPFVAEHPTAQGGFLGKNFLFVLFRPSWAKQAFLIHQTMMESLKLPQLSQFQLYRFRRQARRRQSSMASLAIWWVAIMSVWLLHSRRLSFGGRYCGETLLQCRCFRDSDLLLGTICSEGRHVNKHWELNTWTATVIMPHELPPWTDYMKRNRKLITWTDTVSLPHDQSLGPHHINKQHE